MPSCRIRRMGPNPIRPTPNKSKNVGRGIFDCRKHYFKNLVIVILISNVKHFYSQHKR